jgi:hypothetical protein
MSERFDYTAVMKILVFGLLVGGVLPVVFAVGVRLNAKGTGVIDHGGAEAHHNPALVTLSWLIFSLVLVAVIVGCSSPAISSASTPVSTSWEPGRSSA